MATGLQSQHMLRLTGTERCNSATLLPQVDTPLSATDPRWVLAVRTAATLEGGRAAILRPEKRARLLTLADTLGLRPFDAALIIAIVQDSVRSGEPALGDGSAGRIALIRPAERLSPLAAEWVPKLGLALLLGAFGTLLLVRWLG